MRIIAGEARGRRILAPDGEKTRPTLDRVKESLFGILQPWTLGCAALDLFAGSGNLGLEALSRGAKSCVFNDFDAKCVANINKNLETLGFAQRAQVYNLEYSSLIKKLVGSQAFDIVFLDPPYDEDIAHSAAQELFSLGLVSQDGIVCIEHDGRHKPVSIAGVMDVYDTRRYGHVFLSFLRRGTC